MEFKELEYERLKQERSIRSQITAIDTELAAFKKKKKIEKGTLYKKLADLEKELDGGALQPGLFERNEPGQLPAMPGMEKHLKDLGVIDNKGEVIPKSKRGRKKNSDTSQIEKNLTRKKKDTMKVERTLRVIESPCDLIDKDDPGCCQCEKEGCKNRIVDFGNAVGCLKMIACYACSSKCPRLIEDYVKDAPAEEGKVERTLLTVFPVCDAVKDGACIGCCQCDDSACADKIINFGNAIECPSTVACSSGCPRAIQEEDIEETRETAIERVEKATALAKNAAKNLITLYVLRGDTVQDLNTLAGSGNDGYFVSVKRNQIAVSKDRVTQYFDLAELRAEILATAELPKTSTGVTPVPAEVVINVRYYGGTHIARAVGLGITASSTSDYEPAARAVAVKIYDDNFELIQYGPAHTWIAKPLASKPVINEKQHDKDIANAAKVPLTLTVYKLDLENKNILRYHLGEKKFVEHVKYKSKAETLRQFKRLQENETGFLDIDRITTWPSKSDLAQFIIFQGDYHGAVYDHKQIRFIKPGMHGWGKPEKFTNEQQYYARLEELRKDPNYIEA